MIADDEIEAWLPRRYDYGFAAPYLLDGPSTPAYRHTSISAMRGCQLFNCRRRKQQRGKRPFRVPTRMPPTASGGIDDAADADGHRTALPSASGLFSLLAIPPMPQPPTSAMTA